MKILDDITGFLGDGLNVGWLLLGAGALLGVGSVRSRQFPGTDDVIELSAYVGGIWGGAQLLAMIYVGRADRPFDVSVASGAAAAVVLLSARGAYRVLRKYLLHRDPTATPSPPDPPQ